MSGLIITEYNEAETMQLFKEEGREEGISQEQFTRISDMLKRGKTPDAIAEFCNYPMTLINEVIQQMNQA